MPLVPSEDDVEAEPLLPESPALPLLELLPVEPDDPGDWLVLPGKPWVPDDPVLPDDPGLPDEPGGGDELGGAGIDEDVDSLVTAQPDRASAPASAHATRDHDCCCRIWLDSDSGGR